ncbi:MAG TPA: DUF3048 domain-containing protein [Bacilli bacterium]|nr:DUF3048 domain-containing protein [Bacilli bacterium]
MNRKNILKYFLLLISFFIITGCGDKKVNKQAEANTNKTNNGSLKIIDTTSKSRPYAVVINNYPSAVKVQTGLSDAYLVYEMPVEGGMSRSLAFYKDKNTTKIGTIRSARHNFLDYVMENDAIFAHFGWSIYAQEQIPQLGINNIDGNSSDPKPFWRENPEKLATEHTAYGSLIKIQERAKEKGYRLTSDDKTLLNYKAKEVDLSKEIGVMTANNVTIPYSGSYKVKFTYSPTEKKYYRYVNGKAHTDYFTKAHYSAKNIIVTLIGVGYAPNGYYLDLKNVGTGNGYYITDGKAVPITWTKSSRSAKTVYKYKNGSEINVNDGNTYIMLQSSSLSTTIE